MTKSMMAKLHTYGITDGMVTSAVITLILIVLAVLAGRNMKPVPGRFQSAVELAVGKLYGFFESVMGKKLARQNFAFLGTFFIYILLSNYSGLLPASGHLPGVMAPTVSVNCTAALAIIVFFMTQVVGIRANKGPKYYMHLFKPFAFLFPLMAIEMLVRPLSLSMRLYGNVFGEEQAVHQFFGLCPIGAPVVMQILSVLMGLVQALVFSLLTCIYFMEAAEAEGEELEAV